MFRILLRRRITQMSGLFNSYFIDVKALYAMEFDAISCISFIGELDTSRCYAYIQENMGNEILKLYQHSYFDHEEGKMFFNNTIFVMTGKRMIELGNNYCQILHKPSHYTWANSVISIMAGFRVVNKEPAIGFTRTASPN